MNRFLILTHRNVKPSPHQRIPQNEAVIPVPTEADQVQDSVTSTNEFESLKELSLVENKPGSSNENLATVSFWDLAVVKAAAFLAYLVIMFWGLVVAVNAAMADPNIFKNHWSIIWKYGVPFIPLNIGVLIGIVGITYGSAPIKQIVKLVGIPLMAIITIFYMTAIPWSYSEAFITVSTIFLIPAGAFEWKLIKSLKAKNAASQNADT
jgi:hypothetical protein